MPLTTLLCTSLSRIILILPETGLNVFGTIWAFCGTITCANDEPITQTLIEGKQLFSLFPLLPCHVRNVSIQIEIIYY